MAPSIPRSRRTFLVDLGRGAGALVVVGLAACAPGSTSVPSSAAGSTTTGQASPTPEPTLEPTSGESSSNAPDGAVEWQRVDVGIVSAYVLARSGEAAIVDTGVDGSADAIEAGLGALGLGWDAVGHVILTHRHGDHVGSLGEVMARAATAQGYGGAEDLSGMTSPRDLRAVADGDSVFGLDIVATPGHTAGHVSVLDPIGGVLVAGDALNTAGGRATGPNPQFSADMTLANASVAKLAAIRFETLLVGHGDPVLAGADQQVAELVQGR